MRKARSFLLVILTLVLTCMSVVAFAAADERNPFKGVYKAQAQELRQPGTAKLVYLVMDRDRNPIPGATMIYNTTKAHGLKAVSDEKGLIVFNVKASDLFYIRQIVYDRQILPITGSDLINNVEKMDVRKGMVIWNCIVKYGDAAFMSYRGD